MGSSGIMVLKSIIDRCYIAHHHHHHEFVPSTSYLSAVAAAVVIATKAFPFVEVAPNSWQEKHKEAEVRADTLLQNRKRT